MLSLTALLVLASPLAAPQQDARGTDFWVNRMKERLGLSEDQAAKVREIFTKDADDRQKLDDARTAKVNELLSEEQKKKYEEMRTQGRGFGGGARAGGAGGPGGGFGRGMGQFQMDDLKRELGLSDEQAGKIKPLVDEFGAQVQKRMEEMRTNGFQGLNLAEEMQKGQAAMKELADKVKAHLDDEQKTKLDGLMERMTGWMRMVPQLLGQRQAGTASGPARPSVEERVRRAMEALKVEKDEERAAIRELVEKVVRAQHELEDAGKSARERLGEASKNKELSDAAVEDRIKESIEERRKLEKALNELQKQLVDVVSSRQELELMAQGILK